MASQATGGAVIAPLMAPVMAPVMTSVMTSAGVGRVTVPPTQGHVVGALAALPTVDTVVAARAVTSAT